MLINKIWACQFQIDVILCSTGFWAYPQVLALKIAVNLLATNMLDPAKVTFRLDSKIHANFGGRRRYVLLVRLHQKFRVKCRNVEQVICCYGFTCVYLKYTWLNRARVMCAGFFSMVTIMSFFVLNFNTKKKIKNTIINVFTIIIVSVKWANVSCIYFPRQFVIKSIFRI